MGKNAKTKPAIKVNQPTRRVHRITAQPGEHEIGQRTIDHIEGSQTFHGSNRPKIANDYFVFKRRGDDITGFLGTAWINNSDIRRTCSITVRIDGGDYVEIFCNKLLQKLIEKNKLFGKEVRIVYIGRQATAWGGHARKIYRVFARTGSGKIIEETEQKRERKKDE